MIPVAGSAYTYGYATLGEIFAWIIGWDLILEYAFSAATVAAGWSGTIVSLLQDYGIHLPPNPVVDENPKWLRYTMTGGQLLLALGLAYFLLVRPWVRTPPIDELAGAAEKAIPQFGHRLVTAVQLNRPTARVG